MQQAASFEPLRRRMLDARQPEAAIESFRANFEKLLRGERGLIPEHGIRPVTDLPDTGALTARHRLRGEDSLAHTAMIKLNGGLGTSMGLDRAKSLIAVRGEHCFLDLIVQQAAAARVPLVLMHSFATREPCMSRIVQAPASGARVMDFLQHQVPKIEQATLGPVRWPAQPGLEWCPPGHGDLYTALVTSGTLDALLGGGIRYAFVSNADNLGATLDVSILGYLVEQRLPFLMEVTERLEMDRKGGHLARTAAGDLLLREAAQCAEQDRGAFEDVARYRYFNTNSLWLDLQQLQPLLGGAATALPLICNAKTVDPRDAGSTPVFQLETAMGAAIGVLRGAAALCVPRARFAPVKTTADLLRLRSDAYRLEPDGSLRAQAGHPCPVQLDGGCYGRLEDFEARFARGVPSLAGCSSLRVSGDVQFGAGVVLRGAVRLENRGPRPARVADGAVLEGDVAWD